VALLGVVAARNQVRCQPAQEKNRPKNREKRDGTSRSDKLAGSEFPWRTKCSIFGHG